MKRYERSLERRLSALEDRVHRAPSAALPDKRPVLMPVSETMARGRRFIGWGWYPDAEEIAAIQAGAFVCFTESDVGGAFISVLGCPPRALPAVERAAEGDRPPTEERA